MRVSRAVLVLIPACFAQGDPRLFDYDASAPVGYQETLLKTEGGVKVYDASFASPTGGRVPCYVVAPARKGKFAGIVWQHGGGQNRQWFLPDAIELAAAGAVSVLMDSPYNRPASIGAKLPDDPAERHRAQLIQVAVDARRAIDLLAAREDVDAERIGYAGLSFGAMMGATLAGFETRFKAYVLDAGLEGFVRHYRESPHPEIAAMRTSMAKDAFERLIAAVGPLDAIHYVGRSTAPLLFQAARFDEGVPPQHTYDFFAAAGGKKELRWYNSGHSLNDPRASADRVAWLRKHLKIR